MCIGAGCRLREISLRSVSPFGAQDEPKALEWLLAGSKRSRGSKGSRRCLRGKQSWYQTRSVGGGGMFTAKVPASSCTSTVRSRGVLETSSIFFLMNSFSVAFWKYLDLAILSTKRRIFRLVLLLLMWLKQEGPQLSPAGFWGPPTLCHSTLQGQSPL